MVLQDYPNLFLGKIMPSLLSMLATAATTWLQLRKPQQLWALYRTTQRELEDHYTRFHFRLGEYANTDDPNRLLAEQVAKIALALHYQWLPLVPNPESLKGLEREQLPQQEVGIKAGVSDAS